jgi:uncharacterized C2H2 Zn-finger protein
MDRVSYLFLVNRTGSMGPFHCTQCQASFTCQHYLDQHFERKHGEKTVPCTWVDKENCDEMFKTPAEARKHIPDAHGAKTDCDKMFRTQQGATTHARHVHEAEKYKKFPVQRIAATRSSFQMLRYGNI